MNEWFWSNVNSNAVDSGLEAMGTQKQWTQVWKQWELKRNGLRLLVSGQEALE